MRSEGLFTIFAQQREMALATADILIKYVEQTEPDKKYDSDGRMCNSSLYKYLALLSGETLTMSSKAEFMRWLSSIHNEVFYICAFSCIDDSYNGEFVDIFNKFTIGIKEKTINL